MIRPYETADAEAAAALVAEHSPWLQTAAGLRHRARKASACSGCARASTANAFDESADDYAFSQPKAFPREQLTPGVS